MKFTFISFHRRVEHINSKSLIVSVPCSCNLQDSVADGLAFRVYAHIMRYKFFGQFHEKLYRLRRKAVSSVSH